MEIRQVVVPPWRLYQDTVGDRYREIDRLVAENKLGEALNLALSQPQQGEIELLLRTLSLRLQFGQSAEVLAGATQYAMDNNISIEQLPAPLTLLVAYAYKHKQDIDQTLAWLGVTVRRGRGTQSGSVASREIERLLSRIVDGALSEYAPRWEADQTIYPFFMKERQRRARGGAVVMSKDPDYFSPETYGQQSFLKSDSRAAKTHVGTIVVTLTEGKESERGEEIRRGFDLAREEAPQSAVDYVEEERLVERASVLSGVKFVIGPQRGESVSELRSVVGEGALIFSFANNPPLSPKVVPAGITAEDECEVMLQYAKDLRSLKSVLVIQPDQSLSHLAERYPEARFITVSPGEPVKAELLQGRDGILFLAPVEEYLQTLSALRETSGSLPLIGGSNLLDPPTLRGYVNLFEGVSILTPFYPQSERLVVSRFVSRYLEKYKRNPSLTAAIAYDIARVCFDPGFAAAENSMEFLANLGDFSSVTGIVGISNRIKRRFTLLEVRAGEIVERQ
jgi:hypothetical protein